MPCARCFEPDARDAEIAALRAEIERLRAALTDAIQCVEDWSRYADGYFREKWDVANDLARLRSALAGEGEGK